MKQTPSLSEVLLHVLDDKEYSKEMGYAIEMKKHKESLDSDGAIFLKNIRHAKLFRAFIENYSNIIRPAMLRFDYLKLIEPPFIAPQPQTFHQLHDSLLTLSNKAEA